MSIGKSGKKLIKNILKIMYNYIKYYAIEFYIWDNINKKQKEYLKANFLKMEKETRGIILPSKKIIENFNIDENEYKLIDCGKKLIPIAKYQETITNSQTLFIWNELIELFGQNIKIYAIQGRELHKISL